MPARHRQTLNFMIHNRGDTLKLKLSDEQKVRAEKIRAEIFKRTLRPTEWSHFSNREQHAIEIFLRSDCKDLTSGLPNIAGLWARGNVHFKPRRDANGKPHGGSMLKRVYDQVVQHPERIQRCQQLKHSVHWTSPFNYSTLVANANAIATKDPTASRKAYQRKYTYEKRRQQGKPIKNPSGSPYASGAEEMSNWSLGSIGPWDPGAPTETQRAQLGSLLDRLPEVPKSPGLEMSNWSLGGSIGPWNPGMVTEAQRAQFAQSGPWNLSSNSNRQQQDMPAASPQRESSPTYSTLSTGYNTHQGAGINQSNFRGIFAKNKNKKNQHASKSK